MDKKNITNLPKMIKENPRGLINRCIIQMLEHRDSNLIKSLTEAFKSYSGYKYLTCVKSTLGNHYDVKVHKESPMKPRSKINVPDTQFVCQTTIPFEQKDHSPINVYMLRSGVYVFNQWQLLDAIGNLGMTIDQLGYEFTRCVVCNIAEAPGQPCVRCLSNICEDCLTKVDTDKQIVCPTCVTELEKLKNDNM